MSRLQIRCAPILAALVVAAGVLVAASAATGSSTGGLKVAFVYEGTQDAPWTQSWEIARKAVQAEFGSKLNVTVKYAVPDGPQDAQVFNSLVTDGYKVIVATSFGQQQASIAVAKANPDVKILQVEAPATTSNLASFDYRGADGFFAAGMAAAAATNSDKLGYIAAFPIPSTLAQINAYALGAKDINPKVKVAVVWTNNWDSPSLTQSAAQSLVNTGAKALSFVTAGGAIAQVAKSTNTVWNSFEVDQQQFAPRQWVTSVNLNWKPYLVSQLKALLAGTWKSGSYLATAANHGIQISPFGARYKSGASAANQAKVRTAWKALQSGRRSVFAGPIVDQAGKTMVPAGSRASTLQVATMNYLVRNVQGKIPAAG